MNSSNRYGMEMVAKQQQAEIERQLQMDAQLRGQKATPRLRGQKPRWVGRLALASVVGLIAALVAAFLH